jgi:site-specific recombinase XerC
VSELVDELVAEAKAAKRSLAAYERHMERVRELLPQVRAEDPKKYGPAVLEEMTGKVYERGTISRLTAEAAGTSKKAAKPEA